MEERIAVLESQLASADPTNPLVSDHLRPAGVSSRDPQAALSNQDVGFAEGMALLSLNAASEPHYLGPSSGFSWTQIIAGGLHHSATLRLQSNDRFRWRRDPALTVQRAVIPQPKTIQVMCDAFYFHIQARYPFMDWVQVNKWVENPKEWILPRDRYQPNTPDGRQKGIATFTLWCATI